MGTHLEPLAWDASFHLLQWNSNRQVKMGFYFTDYIIGILNVRNPDLFQLALSLSLMLKLPHSSEGCDELLKKELLPIMCTGTLTSIKWLLCKRRGLLLPSGSTRAIKAVATFQGADGENDLKLRCLPRSSAARSERLTAGSLPLPTESSCSPRASRGIEPFQPGSVYQS